jgi:hypothetical protein
LPRNSSAEVRKRKAKLTSAIAVNQISGIPVQRIARIAGVLYVVNTVTSLYAFFGPHTRLAFDCGLVGTASYVAITILFYILFKPVSRSLSFIALLFSMAGSVVGNLSAFHLAHLRINILVFFGFYCALIGYLIIRSLFMPRFVGVLMVGAGLGYLTFLWPALGNSLKPYNLIPGGIGEWTLTVWLLIKGVDQQGWHKQVNARVA